MQGGSGDDVIQGGVGDDMIQGGAGADQFIYKAVDMLRGSDQINDFNAAEGDSIVLSNSLLGLDEGTVLEFVSTSQIKDEGAVNVDQSMIVDTMGNILSLGVPTNARLAYATDTGDLLFDSNGDWSQGSRTITNLSLNGSASEITTESIQIGVYKTSTDQISSSQSFNDATSLGNQFSTAEQQESTSTIVAVETAASSTLDTVTAPQSDNTIV